MIHFTVEEAIRICSFAVCALQISTYESTVAQRVHSNANAVCKHQAADLLTISMTASTTHSVPHPTSVFERPGHHSTWLPTCPSLESTLADLFFTGPSCEVFAPPPEKPSGSLVFARLAYTHVPEHCRVMQTNFGIQCGPMPYVQNANHIWTVAGVDTHGFCK